MSSCQPEIVGWSCLALHYYTLSQLCATTSRFNNFPNGKLFLHPWDCDMRLCPHAPQSSLGLKVADPDQMGLTLRFRALDSRQNLWTELTNNLWIASEEIWARVWQKWLFSKRAMWYNLNWNILEHFLLRLLFLEKKYFVSCFFCIQLKIKQDRKNTETSHPKKAFNALQDVLPRLVSTSCNLVTNNVVKEP